MRKALLALALLLSAGVAHAQPIRTLPKWFRLYLPIRPQLVPGGGGFGSGGGTANPALNTVQTPDTYYFSTDPLGNSLIIAEGADSGFDFAHAQATDPTLFIHSHNQNTTQWLGLYHNGVNGFVESGVASNGVVFRAAGVNIAAANANENSLRVINNGMIGFTADVTSTAPNALFAFDAAAAIQMGVDVNGAAVNQTFKAHDGITGTDVLGAGLTLEAGRGTGAGVSNPLVISRQITKATGTTAQTYAPAMIVCPSKILSNTSATVQTIATITTTSTTAGGLEWIYTVIASNGTVLDSNAGDMNIAWNNNAGTVAVAASASLGDIQSNGSGTLTAAQTATAATNVISLKYTPTWTVIVPTIVTGFATFIIHSSADTIACQ